MDNYKLIFSNPKIILSDNKSDLNNFKEAIDYIMDTFMSNREERDIKIYLVDNVEDLNIFENIIKPLVNYYLELLGPEKYASLIPYFSLFIETNKTVYTQEQLEFLKNNGVFLVQVISTMPSVDYLALLAQIYPGANIKFLINENNVSNLFELISTFCSGGFYNLSFDIDWENYSSPDFSIIEQQLTQYKDFIINAFENYTVPPVALNFENALCKLIITHSEQQNDNYRTSAISSFSCREGTGSLGDYIIKNNNIYLNKYCMDNNTFKIGGVYDDIDFTIIDSIRYTENYSYDMCNNCYLNRICNNGNPGINYMFEQSYNKMNTAYCQWQNLIVSLCYEIIKHFDIDQNNGLFKTYFTGIAQRGIRVEY